VVDLVEAGVAAEDLELIRKGMSMAVNVPGGTAGRVRMPNMVVAAKTGTAQTTDNGKKSNNSWVISFAPYDKPKYAVCVLAQNAGSGGAVCGPLVHLIYRSLFAQEEGLKLPLRAQTEYAGNTERLEEIELPKELLDAIDAGDFGGDDDIGETGDEIGEFADVVSSTPDPEADTNVTPTPTLTPEIDAEGTVIPRAMPVPE
jgi:penicillin-binding protein 2